MTRNYYLQIQAQRQGYKAAFIDAALWKVLTKTLGSLLKKDWDERLEDDKLIIERILILIRNVLQVPTNVRREGRTMDDVSLHDQVSRESILSHQVIMTLSRLYIDIFGKIKSIFKTHSRCCGFSTKVGCKTSCSTSPAVRLRPPTACIFWRRLALCLGLCRYP